MTQDERIQGVANMLFVNRFAAMNGQPVPFNNEAMLVFLIAPDWFIKIGGGETFDQVMPERISVERIWEIVRADIQRYYPNDFDWENQRRNPAKAAEGVSGLDDIHV